MLKRVLKPLAFALALSFTSAQSFAFAPTLLPPIALNQIEIQNLQTTKDSRGLETLGVNPQIAGFLGSLTAGAVIGGMAKESTVKIMGQTRVVVSQAQNIKASITQALTLNNLGQFGLSLKLDSGLTNVLSLSVAAIQGQQILNPGTTLSQTFSNIKPQLFSSLAQLGIDKIGSKLGWSSGLTNLIGIPIASAMDAQLEGKSVVQSINTGLLRGISSVGVQYATKNMNPLLGSLTSRSVTSAIESSLGGTNGSTSSPQGIFQGIFNSLKESALNVSRLGVSGTDAWSQSQYLQRTINFNSLIQQKGLAKAIEDSATQIFHEDSISSILRSFSSIGAYVQDSISKNKLQTIQKNG